MVSRQDGHVTPEASARFGSLWASRLASVTTDSADFDSSGRWAICADFGGTLVGARFEHWREHDGLPVDARWRGPARNAWSSSLDRDSYCTVVESIRASIAAGDVYQVNACRVMRAPLPDRREADIAGLDAILRDRNPAPYGGYLDLPDTDVQVACASPELFISVRWVDGRRMIRSGPIKGTGRTFDDLKEKDTAENVMIVDLVRNDLSRVCRTGSVHVPQLLAVEQHPGLVHLVSYVEGELVEGCTWDSIMQATFPPGSVTGAPKHAALRIIDELEPEARGPYCGAFGWIDADSGEAELAVAIRTFWIDDGDLCFGTGAGITWGSDPVGEWDETVLKADRLIEAAADSWPPGFTHEGEWQR